eukprot:maker-scaffold299_size217019-snap-gene-0.13 protein:Tk09192 transcript:maker-scaffold299_size217019-snap-gene-0.13-mRNA-1 annotation:"hypothetical protein DAPPUDRAFT_103117"
MKSFFSFKGAAGFSKRGRYMQGFVFHVNTTGLDQVNLDNTYLDGFLPALVLPAFRDIIVDFPPSGPMDIRNQDIDFLYRYGVCFPSSCSRKESDAIIQTTLSRFNQEPYIWYMSTIVGISLSDQHALDAWDISFIALISILACLVVSGTAYNILDENKWISVPHNDWSQFILGFSVLINGRKILSAQKPAPGGDHLTAINGIRFFSMCWVIVSHSYGLFQLSIPVNNSLKINTFFNTFGVQFILNGYPCVDSFFFLSGTFVTYMTFKEIQRANGNFNIIIFYMHRYIRLTGVYFVVMLFRTSLMRYLAIGPNQITEDMVQNCREVLWRHVLYINNFYSTHNPDKNAYCAGPSWYLAADMQMFVVAPLLIYPMLKIKKYLFDYLWPVLWIILFTSLLMILTEAKGWGPNSLLE